MKIRYTTLSALGSLALALSIGACSSGGNSDTGGSMGNAGSGSAGSTSAGTAGSTSAGTAGSTSAGTAGVTGAGGAGTAGATGAGGAGTAGATGAGGAGAAGATGAAGGGVAGATGTGGTGTGTGGTSGPVMSLGCGMPPASADSTTNFTQKIVTVTGVDQAFIAKYPVNNGDQFNWTKRNYYVRLPKGYDVNTPYAVDLEGTGCAGGETTGSGGDYSLPTGNSQTEAIQIGLSYVTSGAANPSCPAFTDDYVNSPEPMYINAVIDDVLSKYCVDKNKVFQNGYSSGAFEASMAGGTNADKLRAIGLQIGGGFRMAHPPYLTKPIAAMFVVGTLDQGNPIGPLAIPLNDTIGSVAARDELLHRNGCVAPDFQIVDTCAHGAMVAANEQGPLACTTGVVDGDTYSNVPHTMWDPTYPKCQTYTGCPAKYPVVWCPLAVNHGNGPNPMGADMTQIENYRRTGMWQFFKNLPAP